MSGSSWRECRNAEGKPKIRYDTRADAKDAARRMKVDQEPYRCDTCGWFHLGHYPTSPNARRKRRNRHRRTS